MTIPTITDPSIRCKADSILADYYTARTADGKPVRVLTFSQKSADWLAKNVEPDTQPDEAEPLLCSEK